jgi:hypothetical protein
MDATETLEGPEAQLIPGTTPISAPVAPTADTDSYPSHLAKYGKGGWRTVDNAAARLAIPTGRREACMVVVDADTGEKWILGAGLTNADWTAFSAGAGDPVSAPSVELTQPGTVSAPAIKQTAGTAGIYFPAADSVGLAANGFPAVVAKPSGLELMAGVTLGGLAYVAGFEADPEFGAPVRATTAANLAADMGVVRNMPTIAMLRALDSSFIARDGDVVATLGYHTAGDGGSNEFFYKASDTSTPDNTGSIIVDAANRRWYQFRTSIFNVKQWGAKGDNLAPDEIAIQKAFDNAVAKGTVVIPVGHYRLNAMLQLKGNLLIQGHHRLTILHVHHAGDGIGSAGNPVRDTSVRNLAIVNDSGFNPRAAILLTNCQGCYFDEIDIQNIGPADGFQYGILSRATDANNLNFQNRFNLISCETRGGANTWGFYGEGFVGGNTAGPNECVISNSSFACGDVTTPASGGIHVRQCRVVLITGCGVTGGPAIGYELGPSASGCVILANRALSGLGTHTGIKVAAAGNAIIGNDLADASTPLDITGANIVIDPKQATYPIGVAAGVAALFDGNVTANETRLQIGEGATLKRVKIGAVGVVPPTGRCLFVD